MKSAFLKGIDPGRARIWIIVAVGGLVLLVAGQSLGGTGGSTPPAGAAATPARTRTAAQDPVLALEAQMDLSARAALEGIAGAGHVAVDITLERTDKLEVADNVTTSRSSGGSGQSASTQTQETLTAVTGQSGQPLVTDQSAPPIAGVLVVASGARVPQVREALTQATETLFGLPAYRVLVLEGAR